MTRLRLLSRTSWLWLDGAAVLIAAAFLACGVLCRSRSIALVAGRGNVPRPTSV